MENTQQSMWYFAYGANMSSGVFEGRRRMRALDKRTGRLDGYRLAFNQPGIPWIEPAFANIRSDSEGEVHGVLWKISAEDFATLDLQEGGGDAYERLTVQVDTALGAVEAYTYITHNVIPGLKPSGRYLDLLIGGARDVGLDSSYIAVLESTHFHDFPGLRRFSPFFMRVMEKAFERGLNPKILFDFYWNRRRN
jgi:gamma-glutamylcyclotransferase (GGCT)/AIG2-like uncharacterized protein YtfP